MPHRSPLAFDSDADGSLSTLLRRLFVLLLVVGLLRTLNVKVLLAASSMIRPIPDPILLGTVVYAGVGLVVLSWAVLLHQLRLSSEQRRSRSEFVGAGVVAAGGLLACSYVFHQQFHLPVFPRELLIAVANGLLVMTLAAIRHTRIRGLDLGLSMPDRSYWATSLGTVVLSAIIALCGTYLYIQTVDTLPPLWFDRDTMGEVWPVELVLSGLFRGVRMGLLFSGAIQTDLSDRLGVASAVTGAAAVSGFPLVVGTILGQYAWQLDLLSLTALVTVDNFLLVVYALGLTQGIWIVTRRAGVELTPIRGASAVVIVTALVTLAIADPAHGPRLIARAAVAGLVAVEYERSQSVWVPMVAYSSFEIFTPVETAQLLLG